MSAFIDILLRILQIVWGLWPLIFLTGVEWARGRRGKTLPETLPHLKALLHKTVFAWLGFVVLWILLTLAKRPPASFFIPEMFYYSLFWMAGLGLVGLEAVILIINLAQGIEPAGTRITLKELRGLYPDEFEKLVAETYQSFGYQVQSAPISASPASGLRLRSNNGEISLVQCLGGNQELDEGIVQDLYAGMQAAVADTGAIITSGTFNPQARARAKEKAIHLYDGEQFLKVLQRALEIKGG